MGSRLVRGIWLLLGRELRVWSRPMEFRGLRDGLWSVVWSVGSSMIVCGLKRRQ